MQFVEGSILQPPTTPLGIEDEDDDVFMDFRPGPVQSTTRASDESIWLR